jgi:predicted RNA-binding protein
MTFRCCFLLRGVLMDEIRYTLISDGPSDRALLPILTWVLRKKGDVSLVQPEWADLRRLPQPPQSLHERILSAIDLFPCDLLFIHRDAERENPESRYKEIRIALHEATKRGFQAPAVCVVPVRMTEAWLLFDEPAIRLAAGNPNGKNPLNIPDLSVIEKIPDPKVVLFDVLREASGLTGRRLKRFNMAECRIRVTDLVSDFSPLRKLSAFKRLERDVSKLKQNGWIFEIDG